MRQRLEVVPVIREQHVDHRAGDEDEDGAEQDGKPQRQDRDHEHLRAGGFRPP